MWHFALIGLLLGLPLPDLGRVFSFIKVQLCCSPQIIPGVNYGLA